MTHSRTSAYGIALLRATLGALLVTHGLIKVVVFTPAGTAAFFETLGFPGALAYGIIAAELTTGLLLILGLFTRLAAIAAMPGMAGALSVHLANGFMFNNPNGGWEFPAFWLVALCVQAILGDGAFALGQSLQAHGHKGQTVSAGIAAERDNSLSAAPTGYPA